MIIKYLSLLIILFGCSELKKNNEPDGLKKISVGFTESSKDISSLYSNEIEFIPLQISEEALSSSTEKIYCNDEYILISDKKMGYILMYDWEGKYLKKIGEIGRGPNQYISLCDFTVINDDILIKDEFQSNIITYSIKEDIINRIKLPFDTNCDNIFYLNEKLYFINNYGRVNEKFFNLVSWNITDDIVEFMLPYDSDIYINERFWGLINYYSIYNEETLIILANNDTIYSLEKNEISAKYKLSFGKNYVPADILKNKNGMEIFDYSIKNDYTLGLESIHHTDKLILGDIGKGEKCYTLIYNKQTEETVTSTNLVLSKFGDLPLTIKNMTIFGNDLILSYDALFFKEMCDLKIINIERIKDKEVREAFIRAYDSIQDDSNQLLIKIKAL